MNLNNKYYTLRHGEAVSNVKRIYSSWPEKFKNPLTKRGKLMIKESAEKLKDKCIDLIFSSDLLRTKKTAEIVGKKLGIKPLFDERLREISFGIFSGKSSFHWNNYFKTEEEIINRPAPKGESYKQVLKRASDFLKEIDKKYKGKNILIISHQCLLDFLKWKVSGISLLEGVRKFSGKKIKMGELRELN